jgi:predicted PurR-regulated permease PerM
MPNSAASHRASKVPSPIPPTSLGTMAVGIVAVAALYFGRDLFVPLALAILLGFALGPPCCCCAICASVVCLRLLSWSCSPS